MSAQHGRMTEGLEALRAIVPLNGILQPLVVKPTPMFLDAMKSVADADVIPHVLVMAEQTLEMAQDAKQFGHLQDDPLSAEGIAYMMKYSAEDTVPAFYKEMNSRCYDADRSKFAPFGPYAVGAVKHMKGIEPYPNLTVLRGVKADLGKDYPKGREVVWHGFCSTTKSMEVLSNPLFCGDIGKRTIFQIQLTQGQAREITRYSLVQAEDEVLLPPGCKFKVESTLPQGDLTLIQLREMPSKAWIIDLSAQDDDDADGDQVPAAGGSLGPVPVAEAPRPSLGGDPPQPADPETELRSVLGVLSVKDLRQRAAQEGCTPGEIDDARDTEAPKAALIELIVARFRPVWQAQIEAQRERREKEEAKERQRAELTSTLQTKSVKELVAQAKRTPNISEAAVEDARDQDAPKPALVQLLATAMLALQAEQHGFGGGSRASSVAAAEPEPEDEPSTLAPDVGGCADDGAAMQQFLRESVGDTDGRGNAVWDASGAEGGKLKICLVSCDLGKYRQKLAAFVDLLPSVPHLLGELE